jgi:hypothetical protein
MSLPKTGHLLYINIMGKVTGFCDVRTDGYHLKCHLYLNSQWNEKSPFFLLLMSSGSLFSQARL